MRKHDIDGMRFYSHFPDMIHGPVDTDAWERRMTGKQTVEISNSQRYKVLGNAVTVNVVEDVMSKLLYNA